MKRLLIVANLFHASPRIPGIGTYLPEFGWQPTIVTPLPDRTAVAQLGLPADFFRNVRIVPAPYRGDVFWFWRALFRRIGYRADESLTEQLQRSLRLTGSSTLVQRLRVAYEAVVAYPDAESAWRGPALHAARLALDTQPFDAVLSTSPYPTSHLVAATIKRRTGLPWLADFRDPWSQNHNYSYGPVRRFLDGRLERRVMAGADAVMSAAPGYAEKQGRLLGKPVSIIANGFFPGDLAKRAEPLTKTFTITYTGSIYIGHEDPDPILQAVAGLIESGTVDREFVKLRFYGPRRTWLEGRIAHYGLGDSVHQYGNVSRQEATLRQRESQLLLLMNWENPKELGVYRLKLFEYLAARRPVILTGGTPGDAMEKVLRDMKAGFHAQGASEIQEALKASYEDYRANGAVSYRGDSGLLRQHSFRERAREVAALLNGLSERSPERRSNGASVQAVGTLPVS